MSNDSHANHDSPDKGKRGRHKGEASAGASHTEEGTSDPFLSAMTFATFPGGVRGGCDCDECGGFATIPPAIVEYIRQHKRLRKETGPLKRTQQRELVGREGLISVYKFTMPFEAEPLVEYGTSHRLVWIQQLPASSVLKAIGKGILGSQDEERGRQELSTWKEGNVYLVPSNGGKAVAWIHSSSNVPTLTGYSDEELKRDVTSENNNTLVSPGNNGGHAILYICKIPKDCITKDESIGTDDDHKGPGAASWDETIRRTCQQELQSDNMDGTNGMQYKQLSQENSLLLVEAISSL